MTPLAATDFAWLRVLVHERSAVVLEETNEILADVRLTPVAEAEGFRSVGELLADLRGAPFGDRHRRVVEAMLTGETSWFRDLHPFEALGSDVVPSLLAARAGERALSIWSAACATGQEPFSAAMLLRENFPQLAAWNVKIVASDLSRASLGRARAGLYRQLEVNRGLPASLLVRYFRRAGADWEIDPAIRSMVEFREINLAEPWPELPPIDIIFLRNVLIYFDQATRREIFARVRRVLRDGGFLFLGAAETPMSIDGAFERVELDKACCYRIRRP